ncbi:hypothetical protein EK21DRAFT_90398 [Setomelanomma holmii]|uniref:Endoplasmic reticulum-based factor for assembly of V-ATPase-domain-containing protein n=1 Tax=Setomelanomma holmii TaxID=210430 RepID=A0A9P4LKI0_9PLEO|nr:hypothetical protein EK21DRAFT_90398 [Setomelanomma holmii]
MVLLTMTPGIVRALAEAERLSHDDFAKLQQADEPILDDVKPGNPISHSQLIDLSKLLKKHVDELPHNDEDPLPTTLAGLLHSAQVYTPPPPPTPQKSPAYLALMARLRAEEEARNYERMLHPPPTRETFTQRFPRAPMDFSIGASAPADGDEDLSYEEVHRQIILIINILISIVCVAVFIWVAARHWTVGKRLGLSLAGSLGIAVAEVAVYAGYVRKVREAKKTEKKKPEIKEIVKSWVIDKGEEKEGLVVGGKDKDVDGVRFRKGKHR